MIKLVDAFIRDFYDFRRDQIHAYSRITVNEMHAP